MRNGTPDSICFMIDAENSYGYSGTSGRTPSFGIAAQAIDPSVKRHKNAVHIHHTDCTYITIADRVFTKRFFIRVLARLFYRCSHLDIAAVTSVYLQHFYKCALPG